MRQQALLLARIHCKADLEEGWEVVDAEAEVVGVDFTLSITGKVIRSVTVTLRRPALRS